MKNKRQMKEELEELKNEGQIEFVESADVKEETEDEDIEDEEETEEDENLEDMEESTSIDDSIVARIYTNRYKGLAEDINKVLAKKIMNRIEDKKNEWINKVREGK